MAFVHLHNHTEYSLLDGATHVYDMVEKAAKLGMPAVAITDHGVMSGVPELADAVGSLDSADSLAMAREFLESQEEDLKAE